jgi:hypothetical protein
VVKADMKVFVPMDIDLTKDQQKEITLKYLDNLYGWEPTYFIKDENIYNNVVYYTHNSWDEDVLVRTATDDDYVMASLLLKIKESK